MLKSREHILHIFYLFLLCSHIDSKAILEDKSLLATMILLITMYAIRLLIPYIDLFFFQIEQIKSSGKIRSVCVGFFFNEGHVIILALIKLTIFSG